MKKITKKKIEPNPTFKLDDNNHMVLTRDGVNLSETLEKIEVSFIEKAIDYASGNKTEASRILGIRRTTLMEKLKRFSVKYKGKI